MDEENNKNLDAVLPKMNVSVPVGQENQNESIITDDALLNVYGEILGKLREDRTEIDGILSNFMNMVLNDGDATSSSKEAIVNLIKLKIDSADKMGRIADLMTRVKLKEKDTFPRYLNASQNNTINFDNQSKKELLKQIHKVKNKKELQSEKEDNSNE